MTWKKKLNIVGMENNQKFGKLPSHQMVVARLYLISKEEEEEEEEEKEEEEEEEIQFGHHALPYILRAYKYIECPL